MNVRNLTHGLAAKIKFKQPGLLQFRGEAHVVGHSIVTVTIHQQTLFKAFVKHHLWTLKPVIADCVPLKEEMHSKVSVHALKEHRHRVIRWIHRFLAQVVICLDSISIAKAGIFEHDSQ